MEIKYPALTTNNYNLIKVESMLTTTTGTGTTK